MKITVTYTPEETTKILDTVVDVANLKLSKADKEAALNRFNDNYEVENNVIHFKGTPSAYDINVNIDLICRIAYRFMPVIKMAEGIFCFLKSFVKDVEDMIGETKTLINGKTSEEYWQEKMDEKSQSTCKESSLDEKLTG